MLPLLLVLTAGCASSAATESTDGESVPAASSEDQEPIPFEDPRFIGLCESGVADFAEGEPSPSASEAEATAQFVREHSILEGLEVADGKIVHRQQQVGTYQVVERPGGTFAVASSEWCYPTE